MSRPGLRPMRALPQLEDRRTSLEKCVFCPKLCRSACPVSNAEPRETLTPWGKMSLAWMGAQGDVPIDGSHGHPAWACTGCHACRDTCDHRNPVAEVLLDTRDALVRQGVAPHGAMSVIANFARHDQRVRAASQRLSIEATVRNLVAVDASEALVIGCGYLRSHPAEARDAIASAAALGAGRVALVEACCGLPLRLAGDTQAFIAHARGVAASLRGKSRITVLDAGCALTLRKRYPEAGVAIEAEVEVELLVERAAKALPSLSRVDVPAGPVRWHDPCQLGRGLGIYEAPRAVLGRALGRAPDEFDDRREGAICSGGGGLLPVTMPEIARDITKARLEAHTHAHASDQRPSAGARDDGGGSKGGPVGRIVTGCASSLRSFRARAREIGRHPQTQAPQVDDLVTWIARSLGVSR